MKTDEYLKILVLILVIVLIVVLTIVDTFIRIVNTNKSTNSNKASNNGSQTFSINENAYNLDENTNSIEDSNNISQTSSIDEIAYNLEENTNSIETSNNETHELSIDEIAYNLFEIGSWKIRETSYSDYYEYEISDPVIDKNINGLTYRKTNVLYSSVEKEYSEIFTGEALNKILNKRFLEIDGYLYVSWGGATGWGITNIKVSNISSQNNEITYLVQYNNLDVGDNIIEEPLSCNMTISQVDGYYRISKIDYLRLCDN